MSILHILKQLILKSHVEGPEGVKGVSWENGMP